MRRFLVSMAVVLGLSCCAVPGSKTDVVATERPDAGSGGAAGSPAVGGASGTSGGAGGGLQIEAGVGGGAAVDPCDPSQPSTSYVGFDFWPTVTSNSVWEVFDFAVVVANAGDQTANVSVERGSTTVATGSVPPRGLAKFHLPWVPELKGGQGNVCGTLGPALDSPFVEDGAYHLTSTSAVSVVQFNPLEYASQGGPAGKDWSSCPGLEPCITEQNQPIGCFSFTNDASLLLPSNTWTGTIRVMGQKNHQSGNFVAITAATDGTTVSVKLAATAQVIAGNLTASAGPGEVVSFEMNRGDVMQLVGEVGSDFSGSLVTASHPVQVISGVRCTQEPAGTPACDHLEETVLPAETLGKRYFVTAPTSPLGKVPGHRVRIYGNSDLTTLAYPSGAPAGAPTQINAGQVVDLENVKSDFEVVGSAPFGVGSFMLGGAIQDPATFPGDEDYRGDPSQTFMIPVEQFRKTYVFLAPDDYDVSYIDVVMPLDAALELDGEVLSFAPVPVGAEYGVARVELGPGEGGAHVLSATKPVGIQVMGYGSYTSYHYPGGSNLEHIAPPPVK